jgi:hypothetical protein
MRTTAIQLGKALNDPITGLTALRRVGITFEKDQEELIKTMVKTGDIAGAQGKILEELESQFGGSARAAAEGIGIWKRVGNAFGDLKERIGGGLVALEGLGKFLLKVLTPAEDVNDITKKLIKSMTEHKKITDKLKDSTIKLTKAERDNLKVKTNILALDIIEQLNKENEEYENQVKLVKEANEENKKYQFAIVGLADRLNEAEKAGQDFVLVERETAEAMNLAGKAMGDFVEIPIDDALRKYNEAQITAGKATEKFDMAQSDLNDKINFFARALIEGNLAQENLIGLNEELKAQVLERIPLLEEEIELKKIADEKAAEQEERERIAKEEQEERDAVLDQLKKDRLAELKKLRIEALNLQIVNEKNFTKFSADELKKRIDAEKKAAAEQKKLDTELAAFRTKVASSFINGAVSGIEDFESSSKDVFKSIARSFLNMLVFELVKWAIAQAAMLNFVGAAGATVAAGALKAAAGDIANFEKGTDSAPGGMALVGEKGPEIVNVPKGSQVIPNHMIDANRFRAMPRFQEGVGMGDVITEGSRTLIVESMIVNAEDGTDFGEKLFAFQESIGTDITQMDA